MKIYISGKITGTDLTETRKRFAAVAKAMKRLDYEPMNPLENGLSEHYIATKIGMPIMYEIE